MSLWLDLFSIATLHYSSSDSLIMSSPSKHYCRPHEILISIILFRSNTSRMVEVVITIVTEEGGSDQLLLQVQQGLGKLQLDRRVTFQVENRFGS